MQMPFGKYKGKELDEVPTDYLEWLLANVTSLSDGLMEEADNQIRLRHGEGVVRNRPQKK